MFFGLVALAIMFIYLLKIDSILAFPTACFLALPIYISVLKNNIYIGLLVLLLSSLALLLIIGPVYTVAYTIFFLCPAFLGSCLLYASNKNIQKHTAPRLSLSMIFLDLVFANIAVVSSLLMLLNYFPFLKANLKQILLTKLKDIIELTSLYNVDTAFHAKLMGVKQLLIQHFDLVLGNVLAVFCLGFTLSNFYIASRLVTKIDKTFFITFCWPQELFLPLVSTLCLSAFLVFSVLAPNPAIELVANIGLISFLLAFFATGLAYLHKLSQPLAGRPLLLALIYIGLFSSIVFRAPLLITISLMGLWATLKYYQKYKYFI